MNSLQHRVRRLDWGSVLQISHFNIQNTLTIIISYHCQLLSKNSATKLIKCKQFINNNPDQMPLKATLIAVALMALLSLAATDIIALNKWSAGQGHTDLILSVNIYNDNSKFVSGSNDYTVKVWSMTDYSLLHTEIFGHVITHISLHPVDNRIFVLVFDGTIKVLDPTSYAILHATTYPGGGNGNFLRFFASNSKYIIGGYDGGVPVFHIYNTATYAAIAGGATTIFTTGQETTVTSVSRDQTLLAAVSSESATPIHLLIYNLATNTLVKSYTDNSALLKWVLFSPYSDQFYITCNDLTLKAYKLNPANGQYTLSYSYSTAQLGAPNGVSASIAGQLIFSANSTIIFLNISQQYPEFLFARADQADIFVIDVSVDNKYLVTGMRNGEITLWQIGATTTRKDEDVMLLIILGSSILGVIFIVLAATAIHKCCCAKITAKVDGNYQLKQPRRLNNKTQNDLMGYNKQLDNSLGIR